MDTNKRIAELEYELTILERDNGSGYEKGAIKRRITHLKKYGVEYPAQRKDFVDKMLETNLNKYGRKNGRGFGSSYSNNTMIKKYGSKYTLSSSKLRSKVEQTVKERYNVDNASKSASIRKKTKLTNLSRYGVTNISKLPSIKNKKQQTRKNHK